MPWVLASSPPARPGSCWALWLMEHHDSSLNPVSQGPRHCRLSVLEGGRGPPPPLELAGCSDDPDGSCVYIGLKTGISALLGVLAK